MDSRRSQQQRVLERLADLHNRLHDDVHEANWGVQQARAKLDAALALLAYEENLLNQASADVEARRGHG